LSCCVLVSRGRGLSTTSAQRCPRAAPLAARVWRGGQDSAQETALGAVRCREMSRAAR
jgi:hypothetical protein